MALFFTETALFRWIVYTSILKRVQRQTQKPIQKPVHALLPASQALRSAVI